MENNILISRLIYLQECMNVPFTDECFLMLCFYRILSLPHNSLRDIHVQRGRVRQVSEQKSVLVRQVSEPKRF